MNADIKYAHWGYSGEFRIRAAGTSHYTSAIKKIAKNPSDKRALVFCALALVPDDNNPHDEFAVKICHKQETLGHLPAYFAKEYRSYLTDLPKSISDITAHAVISNGFLRDGHFYDYSIEVDIPESLKLHGLKEPFQTKVQRAPGYPKLERFEDESYKAGFWLPTSDRSDLDPELTVMEWSSEKWDTVNYYILNKQHIGLGLKIHEVPKDEYESIFGDGPTHAEAFIKNGRFGEIVIKKYKASE